MVDPRGGGPLWHPLREAAHVFCPPLAVASEDPRRLRLVLSDEQREQQLIVRFRSERGLFLRTYLLRVEADFGGAGPAERGELVLRRRKLRWRRPAPSDGRAWTDRLNTPELRTGLKLLQIERLSLDWDSAASRWRFALETLSGSVTTTFFPRLATPNPLMQAEAEAILRVVGALRRSTH
jgi:hypothetical protein